MEVNHSMLLSCKTMKRALVLPAAKHNLREISGPHIDPSRRDRNVILLGPDSAEDISALAVRKMDATGLDLVKQRSRKNGTLAAEILFGLPVTTPVDTLAYFRACVAWVGATFGEDVMLSAIVHHDESAPHCHLLMLPIRGGRWMASGLFGKKGNLIELQAHFFRSVASQFGLRPSAARLSAADKTALTASVMRYLKGRNDAVLHSQTWPVVHAAVHANPRPWAEQLGIPVPDTGGSKRGKTMAQIFTGTGKGPRREKTSIDLPAALAGNSLPLVLDDFFSASSRQPSASPRQRQKVLQQADGTQQGGTQQVRSKSSISGPPSHTPLASDRDSVSSPVSTEKALLAPARAPKGRGQPQATQVPAHAVDASPGAASQPPGRFRGRLGLNTLRDRHKAVEAPAAHQGPSSSSRADDDGTTRERDRDLSADAWDETIGQFRDGPQARGSPTVLRVAVLATPDPDSDCVRQRDDEEDAGDWDPDLGEHVRFEPPMANRCRLLSL